MHTTIKTYTLPDHGMHTLELPRNAIVHTVRLNGAGISLVVQEDELAPVEDRHFAVLHAGEEISGAPVFIGAPWTDTFVFEAKQGELLNV